MSGERGGEGDEGFCFAACVEGGGRGRGRRYGSMGGALFWREIFLNRLVWGSGSGRGGMQRRPWRGMPKIAIRGNFTLGFEQPVKEKLPPKQCSAP